MRALGARCFDHATSDWQLFGRVLCNEAPVPKRTVCQKWALLELTGQCQLPVGLVDWTAINLDLQM
jgi:hypothetical protein